MNKHALLPILVTTMLALFLLLGTAPLSAQTFNDYSPRGHLIGSASQALFAKPTAEILSAPMHSGSLSGPTPNRWTVKCLCFLSSPKSLWSQKLPLRRRAQGSSSMPGSLKVAVPAAAGQAALLFAWFSSKLIGDS